MSIFWKIPKIIVQRFSRWHGNRATKILPTAADEPASQSKAQPASDQPAARSETISEPFEQALAEAAWNGVLTDGELLKGYHFRLAKAVSARTTDAVRHGDLSDRLAALDAELEALIYQPPEPPAPPEPLPEPKVLHAVSRVIPITKRNLAS